MPVAASLYSTLIADSVEATQRRTDHHCVMILLLLDEKKKFDFVGCHFCASYFILKNYQLLNIKNNTYYYLN